jgi:hypothetical protein
MRSFLLGLLATTIFAVAAHAQIGTASLTKAKPYSEDANEIRYGVKAGANFYMIGGSDAENEGLKDSRKTKVGFAGGFLVNIPFADMFSFQPELLYSTEGNLQKDGSDKAVIALSYINIPLMLQVNTNSGFYGETGPQVGFLMSSKAKVSGYPDEDIKDQTKSVGFSWGVGIGYKAPCAFGISARYNFGLSTIDDSNDNAKIMSNGFFLGIFYLFSKK